MMIFSFFLSRAFLQCEPVKFIMFVLLLISLQDRTLIQHRLVPSRDLCFKQRSYIPVITKIATKTGILILTGKTKNNFL